MRWIGTPTHSRPTSAGEPKPYKRTLFDRHGPAAADRLRAGAYGAAVFALTISAYLLRAGRITIFAVLGGVLWGAATTAAALGLAELVGGAWKRLMVDGSSTPYQEQYSQQQALVMRAQVDEALESYEAIIAASPSDVQPRLRAAALYADANRNAQRAAELFREVQRVPGVSVGDDIFVSNGLVDLLLGPLGDPGRALVELRRLIDCYPGTVAAAHAREGLARIKAGIIADRR